jgi:uncharacterized membrane protein
MKDWHCYINNQAYGPYPENLLRELISKGELTADTYVYNDSPEEASKGWQRAGDTEIAALFLNNSQGTQSPPPIQNQGTTRLSREAPEENVENSRHRPIEDNPGKGLNIASMVLGIISLVLIWVVIGIIPAIVGFVLGVVGHGKSRKVGVPTGMATTGIVCSIVALIIFIALLTVVWRPMLKQSSNRSTPTPTTAQTQTPTPDTNKGDAVYKITYSNATLYKNLINSVRVRVIVEITNTGTSDLYLNSCTLDLEDKSGSLVATLGHVTAYPKVISSGEKAYYYEDTTVEGISANTALTIVAHPKIYKAKIDNVRFPVTDVKFVDTTYGGVKVSGRVENTSDKDENLLHVAVVLYDASDNKPIAVLFTFADVAAGDKMGFEATAQYLPDAITKSSTVRFKAYAYPMRFQ